MEKNEIEIFEEIRTKWLQDKSSFGEQEEDFLVSLIDKYNDSLTEDFKQTLQIPNISAELDFDKKFEVYCKSIIWNTSKAIGQNITKEKEMRGKEISLDEWTFLEGGDIHATDYGSSYQPVHYTNDFKVVREKLSERSDKRSLETFDILTDPENYDEVFKKDVSNNNNMKINIVRKKTKMSYRIINKQLKIIKKIIEESM